nr:DNA repair protein [Mammaliicoccus sp. Marseille-Q6498]
MYDYHLYEDRDILCVDMRNFFATVSCLNKGLDPETTKLAVISDTKRQGSIVLAATESLKEIGVKTGSRLFEIPRRNDIYIINPNMKSYVNYSVAITNIILRYVSAEQIHQHNIEEVFIDITNHYKRFSNTPKEFAELILNEILEETHVQCAIGIGSNMFLSKVAKDNEATEHNGYIAEWRYSDVQKKVWSIFPLNKFWGINDRVEKHLNDKGIFTVGDLANYPKEQLIRDYGMIGRDLHLNANGIDISEFREKHPILNPQITKNITLMKDYCYQETKNILLQMVEDLSMQLRSRDLLVKNISFTMAYSNESGVSKEYTLRDGTNLTMDIFRVIWSFAEQLCDKQALYRTLSITLNDFVPERARELNLFIEEFERERNEALNQKFKQDKHHAMS